MLLVPGLWRVFLSALLSDLSLVLCLNHKSNSKFSLTFCFVLLRTDVIILHMNVEDTLCINYTNLTNPFCFVQINSITRIVVYPWICAWLNIIRFIIFIISYACVICTSFLRKGERNYKCRIQPKNPLLYYKTPNKQRKK